MSTATDLQHIPTIPDEPSTQTARDGVVEIRAGQVLYTFEDDNLWGFHWWASRMGVLEGKGWVRTRSMRTAELAAKAAVSTAYAQNLFAVRSDS